MGSTGFGSRGGLGAQIGYEIMSVVLDMLGTGWPKAEIARLSGVSLDYVYKVHHILGGVYRPAGTEYDPRYLDREERYELARLIDGGCSMREAARRLDRQPSTISRELHRNHDLRTGHYLPERAHRLAWERQRRPKASKIATDPVLKQTVQAMLGQRLSPDQVSAG